LREAEAHAAAALQRLTMARRRSSVRRRGPGSAWPELGRRLVQLGDDIERERPSCRRRGGALARGSPPRKALQREATANEARRADVDTRVAQADAVLGTSKKPSTSSPGDWLTSPRGGTLEHGARAGRAGRSPDRDRGGQNRAQRSEPRRARRDLATLASAAETAQAAVAEAEAAALRAEAAHSAARQALDVARAPLAEAERRMQRLDAEAKTLARLLHIDTKNLWPAVIDDLTVARLRGRARRRARR
jgi:chromosome segregation protein